MQKTNHMQARDDNIENYQNYHLKWYTESEYVDIDTGEIIHKNLIKAKIYRIINKYVKYEINREKNIGIRKWNYECREHEQQKLQL